ncbi:hypothetical protein ACHAO1_010608 [Botrytis cinerea]
MDTNASLLLKISDRELIYFTTIGAGTPLWRDSHVKAMSMIDHMTTEEKSKLTTSVINKDNGCSGITPAIPRVGLPGVYFQDSGNCVRVAEFSSSFPSGIHIGARDSASKQILLESAAQGHVLVRNVDNALPLRSPKPLSLFGYDTKALDQNNTGPGYSSRTHGCEVADINEALPYFLDIPISKIAINGTLVREGCSNSNKPSYISLSLDAICQRAFDDGGRIFWGFINVNATANFDPPSDVCLVSINAFSSESIDRVGLHNDYPDALSTI